MPPRKVARQNEGSTSHPPEPEDEDLQLPTRENHENGESEFFGEPKQKRVKIHGLRPGVNECNFERLLCADEPSQFVFAVIGTKDPVSDRKWDLSDPKQVNRARGLIQHHRPRLLVVSPPCAASSSTQDAKATKLFETAVSLCALQLHAAWWAFCFGAPVKVEGVEAAMRQQATGTARSGEVKI